MGTDKAGQPTGEARSIQLDTPRTELHIKVTELEGEIKKLMRVSDDRTDLIGQLIRRIEALESEVGLL